MNDFYASDSFEAAYTYLENDLGAAWTPGSTFFRLWAPLAEQVHLDLFRSGSADCDDLLRTVPMQKGENGTWFASVDGNLNRVYYTYRVNAGIVVCDPYAHAVGVNGHRAMVIDLSSTNPAGWEYDENPHHGKSITDAVIYELHIRDFTVSASSEITRKGKYLGIAETGTHSGRMATGLDHLKELGITHVQIMPIFDFGSVDEEKSGYNWGYDPVNYNVPEGSYATDPYNGAVRIAELKQMIRALHQNGIGVIMDVVYNHVHRADDFCINRITPGYFSRGGSNGSGCGNDTASERSMVRKFIVDSVNYWADEYHMDGFRFDLAGLMDVETLRECMESVHRKHPDCLFYGEGWNMETLTDRPVPLAAQYHAELLPEFAFFNDTIRDALRGSVFDTHELGFVTGNFGYKYVLRESFLGISSWSDQPRQSINYISCHDNHTLIDRLALSMPGCLREELIRRNNLAAAICILSQGVPLMQAGEEFLRTKPNQKGGFLSNTYRSPDSVNALKWGNLQKAEYQGVFRYYQGLIRFRKAFPQLRQTDSFAIRNSVLELPTEQEHLMCFMAYGKEERVLIAFNAGNQPETIPLPQGNWEVLIEGPTAGTEIIRSLTEYAQVEPIATLALVQKKSATD